MVTLKAKQKKLKASGLGNKPRTSDSLKDEEVEKLYASICPQVIINTFSPNSTFTFRPSQRRQTDRENDAGEM